MTYILYLNFVSSILYNYLRVVSIRLPSSFFLHVQTRMDGTRASTAKKTKVTNPSTCSHSQTFEIASLLVLTLSEPSSSPPSLTLLLPVKWTDPQCQIDPESPRGPELEHFFHKFYMIGYQSRLLTSAIFLTNISGLSIVRD